MNISDNQQAILAFIAQRIEEQGVPPYVIFHDATLREMLEFRPLTPEQLRSITGVGESKLKRFGEEFLAVIRAAEYEE